MAPPASLAVTALSKELGRGSLGSEELYDQPVLALLTLSWTPQPGPRCESAEKTESQTLLAHAPSPRTKPHSAVLDCSAQSSVQWSSSEAGIAARCILSLLQFWATAAPSKLFRHVRLSLKHARDTSSSQPTATPASVKPSMQRRRSFRRKPLLHFRNESPTTSSQLVATS